MKFPISFEQFKSDPLKALLLIAALVAMSALYVDSRRGSNGKGKKPKYARERLLLCEAKLGQINQATQNARFTL
jgi:hypothetical protein